MTTAFPNTRHIKPIHCGSIKTALLAVLFISTLPGCSLFSGVLKEERRLSVLRTEKPAGIKEVSLQVSKVPFRAAMEDQSQLSAVRVIEVFNPLNAPSTLPRYRIFGIQKDDALNRLGLLDGDIVVGVDDRILVSSSLFIPAIRLMADSDSSTIEIVRAGQPLLLKYSFVP